MRQVLTVSMGTPPQGAAEGRAAGVRCRDWDWASMIGPIGVTAAGQGAAERGRT
jgi:hypothetical protein